MNGNDPEDQDSFISDEEFKKIIVAEVFGLKRELNELVNVLKETNRLLKKGRKLREGLYEKRI